MHLLLTPPCGRFCNVEHQKMASSKNARMGSVRHRKIYGLLKKWCGVAKGSVSAVDCQEVCECMCLGLCLCMYALFHTYNHTHTLTCAHSHVHSHPLAADCMLTSRWVGQEMLAFLRRLTCVKPTPASTPSTLSSKNASISCPTQPLVSMQSAAS